MGRSTPSRNGGNARATISRLFHRIFTSTLRKKAANLPSPYSSTAKASGAPSDPFVMILRLRSFSDIVQDLSNGPGPIVKLVSYPRETVPVAPLRTGAETLGRVAIRENERHVSWQQTSYLSLSPSAFVIENALVHGSAGLIGVGDQMAVETTWHTDPNRHHYHVEDGMIRIEAEAIPFLSGTHLSLLTSGGHNYWHALIDGVAKLSIIPDDAFGTVQTALFSTDAIGQLEFLALSGLPKSIRLLAVEPRETFRVERLILPWDLHGVFDYHPVINRFFDAVLTHHKADDEPRIERLYIDRRGASQRKLLNEDDLIAALETIGFVPVRLEDVAIDRQITLFREAAIIVSPHGAGLTNIGFASPGCVVIELLMDAYLNWCFRRIAALRKLDYGCVIGTAREPWANLDPGFHSQVWEINVDQVLLEVNKII